MKKKQLISASQIKNLKRCPRFWWFSSVKKIKQPRTPALKFGSEFHAIVEHIIQNEKFKKQYEESTVDMVVEAFESGCFDFDETEFEVEKEFKLDVDDDNYMKGYIDLLLIDHDNKIITITDHKTVKDFKWALTEDTLRADIQMLIYAYWALITYPGYAIKLRHNQVLKSNPSKSRCTIVEVTEEEIRMFWDKIVKVSGHITKLRDIEDTKEVPTKNGCNDYGGCFYEKEDHCGGHLPKLPKGFKNDRF